MVKRTLASDGFEADIYLDASIDPPIYHYIVTQMNSAKILAWGQVRTAYDAERDALDCMHDIYQKGVEALAAG